MHIDLSGRIVLITGATGDLGRVMVRTFAGCGADVAIHYHRNAAMAETLRAEVVALGRRACTVQADVAERDSVLAMRDRIAAELGSPDIIVTNAVSQYRWVHVLDQEPADYDSQYDSCVRHNVLMAQAFVPAMIPRRWGRVIGINTECAMQNHPNQSAYVAGKRGMDGVLRCLAREIAAHQVTVNQVAPGWMISDRDRAAGTEAQAAYTANVPMRRRGTDQEVANAVVFLASDLAAFITGAWLPVCGGNVMPTI